MNQPLSLELSDDAYAELQLQARATGISVAQLAAASLERAFSRTVMARDDAADQAARERFERHFGELGLSDITDADNDRIDADLAREYDDAHEDD